MRAVIQRVSSASVTIAGQTKSAIGPGLLVLLGITNTDDNGDVAWVSAKTAALRIFPDHDGKLNLSVKDIDGDVLVVSQFTLIASTRKGTRPSFNDAARADAAIPFYQEFIRALETLLARPVATGEFGADMAVQLTNDGPVTLVIDSKLRE